MPAFLAPVLLGMEGVFLASQLAGAVQSRNEKQIERAAIRNQKGEARDFGRQISRDIANMKKTGQILGVNDSLITALNSYQQMSPYQEASFRTNEFLSMLAQKNHYRIAALATPTKPDPVESKLAQELWNVTL